MYDVETLTQTLKSQALARVEQLRQEISDSIAANGKRASGRTQASLRVTEDGDTITLEGRGFFPALEYGSARWTGVTGVHCSWEDFRTIIARWVSDKGLNFGQHKEHERTVSAITATIIRKGSRQHRAQNYTDIYDTLVDKAVKDIEALSFSGFSVAVDAAIKQWSRK